MNRDLSIDICRGIAILLVYLGHSLIYHPICLEDMYAWCNHLGRFIESYNMHSFFIISGFLFARSKKSAKENIKAKTQRLLIPYLATMG